LLGERRRYEHVRNLRLERAREMLSEPQASVKEVAHAVGYASLSHFAKAFRRRYGASPRCWGAAPSG
jgi:AraC-like DNA-binding protein